MSSHKAEVCPRAQNTLQTKRGGARGKCTGQGKRLGRSSCLGKVERPRCRCSIPIRGCGIGSAGAGGPCGGIPER